MSNLKHATIYWQRKYLDFIKSNQSCRTRNLVITQTLISPEILYEGKVTGATRQERVWMIPNKRHERLMTVTSTSNNKCYNPKEPVKAFINWYGYDQAGMGKKILFERYKQRDAINEIK